jgi:DNA-binding NarL/FixJ family response regulator
MSHSERLASGRKIRVLIVDDDANFRFALTTLLERDERLEVVAAAANGEQALRYALLLRPDIVTMDIEMPIMDGVEATKQIVELLPNSRVILVSASRYGDRADAARQAGASAYIPKARTGEQLIDIIVAVASDPNPT